MNWLKTIRSRFHALFRKHELDSEMEEEMRLHVEMRTQANIEAGMNPEEAGGAGLFIRTMCELRHVNLGFNLNNVVLLTIKPAISGYSEKELDILVGKLVDPQLIARLESLPSVQSASLSSLKPIADLPWWYASLKPLNGSFDENPTKRSI